jgi:restriction system protein
MNVKSAAVTGSNGSETNVGARLIGMVGAWVAHLVASLRLPHKDYRRLRHIPLPTGGGHEEIDRIVVSQFGVFVIETMHMRGRIYGGVAQKAWVRQDGKQKHAFQNPLPQVSRKAKVVAAMIGLDAGKVFPVLAFAGGARFDSLKPENVTKAGSYVRYIKSKDVPIMTKSDVARIVQQLEAAIAQAKRSQGGDRGEAVKSCPSCGRDMVLRTGKKGNQAGLRFWVCSDYPSCRAAIQMEPEPAPVRASMRKPAPQPAMAAAAPKAGPTHDSSAEFGRPMLR